MAKYRFGDIVKEIKEKIDRENNPYEYYIAGDHMDTDELHLLRRGVFEGNDVGPAFIRIFKPGQVLYGSRRTYLRKVAVADFEGITANTTFVLETKDESILLQRLLPFIMQSDRFVQYSIKRSKGSTNPYVLFSDLADYDVELPNIEKQNELADLLWAIDAAKMSYKRLISATDELVKSQFIEWFGDPASNPFGWEVSSIGNIASDVRYGTSKAAVNGGKYPYIRMNNLTADGKLDLSDLKYIDIPDSEVEKCLVHKGDILFNRTNSKEWVGKTALFNLDEDMVIAGYIIRVRVKPHILPSFVVAYMNLPYMKKILRAMAKGAVHQANINAKEMQDIQIYLPPLSLQERFAAFVRESDKSKTANYRSLMKIDLWRNAECIFIPDVYKATSVS